MAGRELKLEQEAEEDLEAGVVYYRERGGVEVALRFVDAVEEAILLLRKQPEAGRRYETAPMPRLRNFRAWPLRKFPYVIFYEVPETAVSILGVVEGHQNLPEIFRKRWKVS